MQGKGGLKREVEGLVSQLDTTLKDNEACHQQLQIIELKIFDLEKVYAMVLVNNETLIVENAELELKHPSHPTPSIIHVTHVRKLLY